MVGEWRSEGLGPDVLEAWAVGYAGQELRVEEFAGDATIPCFVDTPEAAVFDAFAANANVLLVIDADGTIVESVNLAADSLERASTREHLDELVRRLLGV
jgi:hypothetical protein